MVESVKEIMARNIVSVSTSTPITEAAREMRDADVGNVIVEDGGEIRGIVTDRDIVVRAVAEQRDPGNTTVGEICSGDVVTVSPDERVEDAARIMRERSIRRLPVVEGGRPVGVVSIGDLAIEKDPRSALADISAAEGNV